MPALMPPLAPLAADAPLPSSDPRDFQGAWVHDQPLETRINRDMYGVRVPYTLAAAQILKRRVTALDSGRPYSNASAKCRPPGPEWQRDLNSPFLVFQSRIGVEFMFQEYHGRWKIAFDRADLPQEKPYMGRSIGHWDGDTLVVETRDFKQDIWLDVEGTPLSADGTLIQRIRKIYRGERNPILEIVTTIVDPKLYERPWSIVSSFGWQPNHVVLDEYNCEEQIGDPGVAPDAGLSPEPAS